MSTDMTYRLTSEDYDFFKELETLKDLATSLGLKLVVNENSLSIRSSYFHSFKDLDNYLKGYLQGTNNVPNSDSIESFELPEVTLKILEDTRSHFGYGIDLKVPVFIKDASSGVVKFNRHFRDLIDIVKARE